MSSVSPRDKWKKVMGKVSTGAHETENRKLERASSILSTTSMNSIQEEETHQDEVYNVITYLHCCEHLTILLKFFL